MLTVAAYGKTLTYTGFLLGCGGAIFPFLDDYRYMNGLETALLFLNRNETVLFFIALIGFFVASGVGLALSLKRGSHRALAFPAVVASAAGLWISWQFAFKLAPFGWAALGGTFLHVAGIAILALASRRRGA